jgi:hypothetical protein
MLRKAHDRPARDQDDGGAGGELGPVVCGGYAGFTRTAFGPLSPASSS